MNLLFCSGCGTVINSAVYSIRLGYNLLSIKENNPGVETDIIFFNWVDIEQTEKEYLKFCPICKKWEFHKKVIL